MVITDKAVIWNYSCFHKDAFKMLVMSECMTIETHSDNLCL